MESINFGNKNSYDDWGLVLVSADTGVPEPVTSRVEVPGMDGTLDLTYALGPRLKYRERALYFEFAKKSTIEDWQETGSEITGFLHGQRMKVSLSADEGWYFDGVCVVESEAIEGRTGTIRVRCDAYPYKLKSAETVKSIAGDGTIDLVNSRMPVCPSIENTEEATLVFGGKTVVLSPSGETPHIWADLILEEGSNPVEVTSEGTTTFTYREGSL